ncbi:hypothetical protein CPC08DRAFT_632514, partial [Agrocybe pediades]
KPPTNKGLLASFNGSVSYLAPCCQGIRIPMALLAKRAAESTPWQWTPTEQRAFDQVKESVQKWRDTRREPIIYAPDAEWINLTCDASLTGGSGVISQGNMAHQMHQNFPAHQLHQTPPLSTFL